MIPLPSPPENANIRAIATWLDTHTTGGGSGAVPWANITGTPTTVAGYGITDAYTKTASDARYLPLAGGTLSGSLVAAGGYGAGSGGSGYVTLGGQAASPNAGSLSWGDGSGWLFNMGPRISGAFVPRFTFTDSGAFTAAGDISGSDLHANRASAPTTGVIYLGNNSGQSYLYYDGSNYTFGQVAGKGNTVTAANFVLA